MMSVTFDIHPEDVLLLLPLWLGLFSGTDLIKCRQQASDSSRREYGRIMPTWHHHAVEACQVTCRLFHLSKAFWCFPYDKLAEFRCHVVCSKAGLKLQESSWVCSLYLGKLHQKSLRGLKTNAVGITALAKYHHANFANVTLEIANSRWEHFESHGVENKNYSRTSVEA